MARSAQRRTDIDEEVVKIYKVPFSGDEIADIHAAYYDCAQRTASAPKRKAIRPTKNNNKKTEISGPSSSIEITYHGQQLEVQEATNLWCQQICNESLAVWSIQWDDYTWTCNYMYDCERAGVLPWSDWFIWIFLGRHFCGSLHRPCVTVVLRSCAKSFG